MNSVPVSIKFPSIEEEVLSYWESIDAFQTSLKLSEGKPEYSFYDGPPFATGLPHYGHILAGTIKDIVTRYAHQTGHHVIRRFGWDTHGLPVEFEIDKQLGVKTRDDVLAMGIPRYNAACRSIVMRYASEWEIVVKRLGRWIDFKNDYKTLDPTFMESVWWVFAQLFQKNLVYKGFKVMPYSIGCTTPLSNFEANLNYKNESDPAIIVSFPLVDDPSVELVAWTTTPWTLPSNLALCVNPGFDYVKVKDNQKNKIFILLEDRLIALYKKSKDNKSEEYEILEKFKGSTLEGKKYIPLFNYFVEKNKSAFRVVVDEYVTNDSGTGIVHQAPAFGEDDFRVCENFAIIQRGGQDIPCPVDPDGKFTDEVTDFAKMNIREAYPNIRDFLKKQGRLVSAGSIVHSIPFCWRSETPLIYKAVPSWFVAVEKIKNQLIENNKKSYWVPDFVQEKRFHNWLVDARDWAISRNRYWGTPIPIWASADFSEIICVGSVAELEKLSGIKVTDLHRESIDHITIPSQRGPEFPPLKRIEEVFDCWFESGSMPYAQWHYPFNNKEIFEKSFPADFIAEGLDQTRGWFYTLLVISTALFDKPAFKNLIVNGLVLASDGKKMSKRLKNYPDPMNVVNSYGADALRLYLINSPVVRAEPLKFSENGVKSIIKDVFLPWFNAYRFLSQSIIKYESLTNQSFAPDFSLAIKTTNIMDQWILSFCQSLVLYVRKEMAAYRLYTVIPRLVEFIEHLTNWYVRFNRKRLKCSQGVEEAKFAINTLFEVLLTICVSLAPFTPFFTEYMYQNLKRVIPNAEPSIHFRDFPIEKNELVKKDLEAAVATLQKAVELARTARDRKKLPIKYPLRKLTIISKDEEILKTLNSFKGYIKQEVNVRDVELTSDEASYISVVLEPNFKNIGQRFKDKAPKITNAIKGTSLEQVNHFIATQSLTIEDFTLGPDDLTAIRVFKGDEKLFASAQDKDVIVVLEITVDEDLVEEGMARQLVNKIQKLRKSSNINEDDPIEVFFDVKDKNCNWAKTKVDIIESAIGRPISPLSLKSSVATIFGSQICDVMETPVEIVICRQSLAINSRSTNLAKFESSFISDIQLYVTVLEYNKYANELKSNGRIGFKLNGKDIELQFGVDVFLNFGDLSKYLSKTN
eukprot:TRINITY_DN2995_c0_g1_i1.p1 TRINITY_DN2995_c0_g1~~TRINITY_DN2995_c0_g1_i1.p1  ORF type:complete len:1143 (+),score=551.91 TRINITY_DN2995_c0_g1_i1:135-3563(+)